MSQTHAMLRFRLSILEGDSPIEPDPRPYPDERAAIAKGKDQWPKLYERALMEGFPQEITVIDRQGKVCWERRAPVQLVRDHTLPDNLWLLHVLQQYGPLSTPQLEAIAGLKRSAIFSCLHVLEAQGSIEKRGALTSSNRGRRAVIWDIADVAGGGGG
jgi:hypothetical protein